MIRSHRTCNGCEREGVHSLEVRTIAGWTSIIAITLPSQPIEPGEPRTSYVDLCPGCWGRLVDTLKVKP